MSFGESFGTCMRKYVDFTGRARRSEFWWFYLAVMLILFPFAIAFGIAFIGAAEDLIDLAEEEKAISFQQFFDSVHWEELRGPALLIGAAWLFVILPMTAATARRLHDIGLSGWWMLIGLFPMGSPVLLVMCVIDGQARENRWGPDPKAGEREMWGQVPATPPPPPTA